MAPLMLDPASLSTKRARLTMSSIEPSPPDRDHGPEPIGLLAGEEPASALGVADRAWSDRVDPDALGPPLDGQGAGHGVDRGLRRGDVHLAGRAAVVQGGADVEDLATVILEPSPIGRPRDVPRPLGVDVDHRAEAVGAQVGRRAKEVARGVVDDDIQPAQFPDRPVHGRVDGLGLADVGGNRQARRPVAAAICSAAAAQVLRLAADDRHVGAVASQGLGNPAADARGTAGDQGDPAREQGFAKDAHGCHRRYSLVGRAFQIDGVAS